MSSIEKIQRFNKQINRTILYMGLARGVLMAVPILVATLSVLALVDHWVELPSWVRQIFWLGLLTGSAGLCVRGFWPLTLFTMREKTKNFYRQARSADFRQDDLRLALELGTASADDGISEALRLDFLDEFAKKIEGASPRNCFPAWNWKKGSALALASFLFCGSLWAILPVYFPVGPRLLFPFGSIDLIHLLHIEPGDADVPFGGETAVRVTLQTKSLTKPILYVKVKKDWLPMESSQEMKDTQVFKFQNVVEPLVYRVSWKNDWSRKYTLTPIRAVQLSQFDITLHQPAYLGNLVTKQTSPEIAGLPGTQVELVVEASMPVEEAKIVFSDASEKVATLIKGQTLNFDFALAKSGTYDFELTSKQGRVTRSQESYPIHIESDNPPTISLLSPEEDLVVGEKEKLPLTFNAQDDYGVKEIYLITKSQGGAEKRKWVRGYTSVKTHLLETYDWDLAQEGLRPGQVIQYRLEVLDANVVSGPGRAQTAWRIIEIRSFEKGHEAIEQAMESWRDQVLNLLADVNTVKSKANREGANLKEMASEFNKSSAKAEMLQKALDRIVSSMEEDPLADYGVWLEHRSMAENMAALNQGPMKRAQAALQTENKSAATSEMDQAANELERMLSLSEELSKSQRARDVMDKGEQLAKLGEEMKEQLEGAAQGKKMDKEMQAQIEKMVSEAQKMIYEMAKALKDMPQDLPEDFVNQAALKDLKMAESQNILSEIQKAIQKGDAARALDLAKQFMDMAKKMKEHLQEAHESFLKENSSGGLAKEIEEQMKKLDDITDQQRSVLAQTQKLESKRMEAVLAEQKKLLDKLAERQEKVVKQYEEILKKPIADQNLKMVMLMQVKYMQDVAIEFRAKKLDKSPVFLQLVIAKLKEIEVTLIKSESSSTVPSDLKKIYEEEQDILNELQKSVEPKNPFSDGEKKEFQGLKDNQKELSQKTQNLKKGLQALSQKTASLGLPVSQALSEAANEMESASSALGGEKSQSAQQHEEQALSRLQDAQDMMGQAQQSMQSRAGEQGGAGSGSGGGMPRAIRRGQMMGSQGSQTGKVRLPSAEDYRPPKEFREELLESLKEKYPEIYEDIIHKYFKRLSD